MTAIAHRPLARSRGVVTVVITTAIAVGLSVALMLSLTSTGSTSPASQPGATRTPTVIGSGFASTVNSGPDNPSRGTSRLCAEFDKATPGSPAFVRLADSVTAQGSC